ncbi:MAG: ABC transporter ATP-binding protein [Vampirovibrio sp.]
MSYLTIENLTKQFGETRVLESIHFAVEKGDFVVLVGSSGCGKSTLLRCIAGLEDPTAGNIQLEGVNLLQKAPQDRDLAMVFQNYALYPHMNVFDNMAFGLKMRKTPKALIKTKVQDVAEILGLEPLLKRKPAQLSGGQCQRVALGRAMVRNPKLFLMDEPLSNLDAQLRQHMRHELKALHQKLGATTLYVTHDHTETLTLADKVVVLHEGRIAQYDSPVHIYQAPATVFVAKFMAQMNILPLYQDHAGYRLQTDAGDVLMDSFVLPEAWQAALAPAFARSPDQKILWGIRPEHLRLFPEEGAQAFHVFLQQRELHGAYQTLRLSAKAHTAYDLVAHASFELDTRHHTEAALPCGFFWKDVQFFDAQSHERIPL